MSFDSGWSDLTLEAKLALDGAAEFKDDLQGAAKDVKAFRSEIDTLFAKEDENALTRYFSDGSKNGVKKAKDNADELEQYLDATFSRLAGKIGAYIGFDAILSGLSTGIKTADQLRDLTAAVASYTGGVDSATKALSYFRQEQDHTRSTAQEMMKVYRDLLPHMQKQGFSLDTAQQTVVDLARLSATRGIPLEQLDTATTTVLAGRIIGGNPLLKSIGVLAKDVRSGQMGIDDLLTKIHEMGKASDDLGDSFESMGKKIKFNLAYAFSEGFNEARGSAKQGMDGLKEVLNSPDVLDFTKKLGGAVADYGPKIVDAIKITIAGIEALLGGVQTAIALFVSGVLVMWKGLMSLLASTASLIPDKQTQGTINVFSGFTTAPLFDSLTKISSYGAAHQNDGIDVLTVGTEQANAGAEKIRASWETIQKIISGKAVPAIQTFTESTKRGADHFGSLQTAANNLGKTLAKAKDDLDSITQAITDHGAILAARTDVKSSQANQDPAAIATSQYFRDLAEETKFMDTQQRKIEELAKKLGANSDEVLLAEVVLASTAYQDALNLTHQLDTQLTAITAKTVKIADNLRAKNIEQFIKDQSSSQNDLVKQSTQMTNEEARAFAITFTDPLANAFSQMASDGGSKFGKEMARAFQELSRDGAANLVKVLSDWASSFGMNSQNNMITKNPLTGKYQVGNQYFDTAEAAQSFIKQNSTGSKATTLGMAGAEIGLGAFYNAQAHPQGSMTSGLIGGAMSGVSMASTVASMASISTMAGGIIGAVVGLVIGGVAAYLGKASAQADYKYGVFNVDNTGTVKPTQTKNITANDVTGMTAQVQKTFDTFWNGYVNLLIKFPESKLFPALQAISGMFQDNASSHFMDNFNSWLQNKLPKDIADIFQKPIEQGFVQLGLSVDRFNEIWNKLGNLDPQAKLDALNTLVDALTEFNDAVTHMKPSTTQWLPTGDPMSSFQGAWADQMFSTNQSFADKVKDTDKQIIDLASHLKDLTGVDQINAAKQIADLTAQRWATEKQAIQDLLNLALQIDATTRTSVDQWTAANITKPGVDSSGNPVPVADPEGQIKFWKSKADSIMGQIGAATDPTVLNNLWGQYNSAVNTIVGLGEGISPQYGIDIRNWAIQALTAGQTAFDARIAKVGSDIDASNKALLAKLQPFWDGFTQGLATATTNANTVGTGFDNLNPPIDRAVHSLGTLADTLDSVVTRLNNLQVNTNSNVTVHTSATTPAAWAAYSASQR